MIREHLEQIARHRATLPLLLLLALCVRGIRLNTQELGYDEMLTAFEANGLSMEDMLGKEVPFTWNDMRALDTPAHVVQSSLEFDGGNGVLYALALHGWKDLFGNGTFAWRSLCVTLGLLAIVLLHRMVLALGGSPVMAFMTALIATVHAQFVDYSQEVRGYMLAVVLLVSTVVVALQATTRERSRWFDGPLMGCLAAGALFSHYFTAYILVPFAIWYWLGRHAKVSRFGTAMALAIPVLAIGLWAVHVGGDGLRTILHRNTEIEDLVQATGGNPMYPVLSWASALNGLSSQFLTMAGAMAREGQLYSPPAFALLILSFVLAGIGVRHVRHGMLLLVLALAAPVNGILLSLFTGHAVALRTHYALFSTPFMIMLIAAGVCHLLDKTNKVRIAVLLPMFQLIAMIVGTFHVWKGTHYLGPDRCAADARHVERAMKKDPHGEYHLVHGSRMAALILGVHLREPALDVPTIVRPIGSTTLLVRTYPVSDTLVIR